MSILKVMMHSSGIWDRLKSAALVLLLVVYLCGNTGSGVFHRLVHGHDSFILHSPLLEKDPCHRVTYHFEKDNRCQHDSHFGVNEACGQCDMLCHPDQIASGDFTKEAVGPGAIASMVPAFLHLGETFICHPSRAPPVS